MRQINRVENFFAIAIYELMAMVEQCKVSLFHQLFMQSSIYSCCLVLLFVDAGFHS